MAVVDVTAVDAPAGVGGTVVACSSLLQAEKMVSGSL